MQKPFSMGTVIGLILIGLAAGTLSGLMGIGGGVILVPGLIYLLGYSQHMAQGTTLGMLVMPVGILGVYLYYKNGYVNFKASLLLALGFVIGSLLGTKIAVQLPAHTLRKLFAILMIILALRMLLQKS